MSGLINSMMSSASGMRTSQSALGTVSHNIANADTEGYSRQSMRLGSSTPTRVMGRGQSGLIGQGVYVESVERAQSRFMDAQVMRDRMSNGFFQGRKMPLENFELMFDNGTDSTVSDHMQKFFSAVSELSQNPSSASAQNGFIEASREIARSFRSVATDVQLNREQVDVNIVDRVNRVNALTEQIAGLNVSVASTRKTGGNVADYEDRRDLLMKELGGLVDVRFHRQANGLLNVETSSGFVLVRDDKSATLETTPNPANDGLLEIVHTSINQTQTVISDDLSQGEIAGLLDSRDRIMGTKLDELDALAFNFASEVNAVHQAGFGQDGVNGRDLFVQPLAINGSALSLEVEAGIINDPSTIGSALDPLLLPGDNRNLLNLATVQDQRSAALGNQTYNQFFSEMLRSVGAEVSQNLFDAEFADVRLSQSEAMRESVVGVSVDDELVDLTRFQKHFQANTRVLETTNRLMDEVMRIVG